MKQRLIIAGIAAGLVVSGCAGVPSSTDSAPPGSPSGVTSPPTSPSQTPSASASAPQSPSATPTPSETPSASATPTPTAPEFEKAKTCSSAKDKKSKADIRKVDVKVSGGKLKVTYTLNKAIPRAHFKHVVFDAGNGTEQYHFVAWYADADGAITTAKNGITGEQVASYPWTAFKSSNGGKTLTMTVSDKVLKKLGKTWTWNAYIYYDGSLADRCPATGRLQYG